MDAKTKRLRLPSYAIRLTMAFVIFSWIGWQLIILSLAMTGPEESSRATYLLEVGVVLILYSANILLRLKRHEAEPSREAAQLFFGASLVVLPLATLLVHQIMKHYASGTSKPLMYLSLGVSAGYFILFIVWLQTTVGSYPYAKPDSISFRIVKRLRMMFIDPYTKGN